MVVFIFLQSWRATLIPLLTVPVSLVGVFIVFPFLGLFVYYITNADGMAQRQMAAVQQAQGEVNTYIKDVASSSDPRGIFKIRGRCVDAIPSLSA